MDLIVSRIVENNGNNTKKNPWKLSGEFCEKKGLGRSKLLSNHYWKLLGQIATFILQS